MIALSAAVALSLIVLIFVFVAREAVPVLTSPEVHEEVDLDRLFLAQDYGTADDPLPYVWQPVSEVPKYSLLPLFLGTLKVTLVAMCFAVPISILAAVYTTEFAPDLAAGDHQARRRASGRDSFRRLGFLCLDGHGGLDPGRP